MGRILALDIGGKRTGVAVTDCLRIVPGGLGFQPTYKVAEWVKEYASQESVDIVVIGKPLQADGSNSESTKYIEPVVNRIQKLLPSIEVVRYDERYTTVLAHRAIIEAGIGKMKRREKGLADQVSAVIILQGFLDSKVYKEKYNK